MSNVQNHCEFLVFAMSFKQWAWKNLPIVIPSANIISKLRIMQFTRIEWQQLLMQQSGNDGSCVEMIVSNEWGVEPIYRKWTKKKAYESLKGN